MALVVGNTANDARGMAAALRGLGFQVTLKLDLTRDAMLRAAIEFSRELADGGVGLFYYAGHAIQVGGRNYLIPIGATFESEDLVPLETVELDQVLWRMGAAPSRLNIVILDACRDNPFARSFRGLSRGLAATPAPAGVFIAYATSPGGVASDGAGRDSPYTAALMKALEVPGLRLEDVFKRVLAEVRAATRGLQTPWTSASITGDFYFRLPEAAPPAGRRAPTTPARTWPPGA